MGPKPSSLSQAPRCGFPQRQMPRQAVYLRGTCGSQELREGVGGGASGSRSPGASGAPSCWGPSEEPCRVVGLFCLLFLPGEGSRGDPGSTHGLADAVRTEAQRAPAAAAGALAHSPRGDQAAHREWPTAVTGNRRCLGVRVGVHIFRHADAQLAESTCLRRQARDGSGSSRGNSHCDPSKRGAACQSGAAALTQ